MIDTLYNLAHEFPSLAYVIGILITMVVLSYWNGGLHPDESYKDDPWEKWNNRKPAP